MDFENKSGPYWAVVMKHTQFALFHVNGEIGLCARSDLIWLYSYTFMAQRMSLNTKHMNDTKHIADTISFMDGALRKSTSIYATVVLQCINCQRNAWAITQNELIRAIS